MLRFFIFLILIFFTQAESKNPLEASFISKNSTFEKGEKNLVAFHLKHPQGYHTYWQNPGNVGVATSVEWELPKGITADAMMYPTPELVKMARHFAYGYEHDTLLIVPITVPDNFSENKITLRAYVSWMCCADGCYPASKIPFTLTIPVTKSAEKNLMNEKLFNQFENEIASQPCPFSASHVVKDKNLIITILAKRDLGEVSFFSLNDAVLPNNQQSTQHVDDKYIITIPINDPKVAVSGVLKSTKGWTDKGEKAVHYGSKS